MSGSGVPIGTRNIPQARRSIREVWQQRARTRCSAVADGHKRVECERSGNNLTIYQKTYGVSKWETAQNSCFGKVISFATLLLTKKHIDSRPLNTHEIMTSF